MEPGRAEMNPLQTSSFNRSIAQALMNRNTFDTVESALLALASKIGVWLTPLVPAYFVQRAMVEHLQAPPAWGWIAAAALEIVGLAAVKNLLRAYTWEQERRKTDPPAPMAWNIVTAAVYYVTAFLLVLVIEFYPPATALAPAAFVVLSGAAALVIALSDDQNRRQAVVSQTSAKRQEASAKRQPTRSERVSQAGQQHDTDKLQAARRRSQRQAEQRLLTYLADNPNATHDEAAAHVGRSRPWVTGKVNEWRTAGIIHKNGAGYETRTT